MTIMEIKKYTPNLNKFYNFMRVMKLQQNSKNPMKTS